MQYKIAEMLGGLAFTVWYYIPHFLIFAIPSFFLWLIFR